MKVEDIISEPIKMTVSQNNFQTKKIVKDLLELVELDGDAARKYPHAFSGGQRQRISIAQLLSDLNFYL